MALKKDKIRYRDKSFSFNFKPIEFNNKQTVKVEKFINNYINERFAIIEDELQRLDEFLKKYHT